MYRQNLTSDQYGYAVHVSGGRIQCNIIFNSGSGTVTLKQAYPDDSRAVAANFAEFSTSTTVTGTTRIGIEPGISWLVFQVSGSSSPDIDVELLETDKSIRVLPYTTTPA